MTLNTDILGVSLVEVWKKKKKRDPYAPGGKYWIQKHPKEHAANIKAGKKYPADTKKRTFKEQKEHDKEKKQKKEAEKKKLEAGKNQQGEVDFQRESDPDPKKLSGEELVEYNEKKRKKIIADKKIFATAEHKREEAAVTTEVNEKLSEKKQQKVRDANAAALRKLRDDNRKERIRGVGQKNYNKWLKDNPNETESLDSYAKFTEHQRTKKERKTTRGKYRPRAGKTESVVETVESDYDPEAETDYDPEGGYESGYAKPEEPDKKNASMGVGKAEEGPGGMNMGAQRGLGHEAGNIQGSGESTQITEVEEKDKSAYENHEQDESPDSQPNKQQIPSSKVGMDAIKSRVNLIKIKYKNIYKLANL